MMQSISKWLANHSISAKTAITVWGFLTLLWSTNDQFRAYLMGIYTALPTAVHNLIAGIVIPVLILWRTQTRTTVTAEISPGQTGVAVGEATAGVTNTGTKAV
jgi:hypothetical protein